MSRCVLRDDNFVFFDVKATPPSLKGKATATLAGLGPRDLVCFTHKSFKIFRLGFIFVFFLLLSFILFSSGVVLLFFAYSILSFPF